MTKKRPLFVHLAPEERAALDRLVAEIGAKLGRSVNASHVVRHLLRAARRGPLRKHLHEQMTQAKDNQ